jgi:hypothetical protein
MALSSPALRRFVRHALTSGPGGPAPGPAQLASAFNRLCDRLRARLQPLFGATPVDALFARALHVATAEFPWLPEVIVDDDDRCSPEALDRVSADISRDALEAGLATVLAHDIGLLTAFIGEDFVMPLVQAAWDPPPPLPRPARIEGDHE